MGVGRGLDVSHALTSRALAVGRVALLALVTVEAAFAGCAHQARPDAHAAQREGSEPAEPVHDPANDWRGDRLLVSRAPTPPPVAPSLELIEPRELREFTETEGQRIRRVQRIVHAAARARDLPPDLVNGIIWVESKFNPRARGRKGPRGLMQLMPRTARELARQLNRRYVPFDPDFNIHAGTYYFWRMVNRYDGNLTLALAAYNIGPAVVDTWVRDGMPLADASRRYVEKVFTAARAFRERGP